MFTGAFAASFQLDPTAISTPSGSTFDVKVTIDTGTDTIKSADAWILYDPTVLEAQTVTDGTFFTPATSSVNHDLSTSGKVYISGLINDPTNPLKGKGTMGTITFKALNDGTNTLKFDCTDGSTTSSLILKADTTTDTNIITCAQNGTSTITVGTGANTTPTGNNLTPAPSELPKSGVFENVIKFAAPGTALLLIGLALKLL